MTMSRFLAAPQEGQLDRLKRMYGYVEKLTSTVTRVRADSQDFLDYLIFVTVAIDMLRKYDLKNFQCNATWKVYDNNNIQRRKFIS
jgi:hypothetical protein